MDKSTIFQEVQKLLLFRDFPCNIKLSSKLKDNLHMDDFDYAVLKAEIFEQYNILFTQEEYQKWETVKDVVTAISEKISKLS